MELTFLSNYFKKTSFLKVIWSYKEFNKKKIKTRFALLAWSHVILLKDICMNRDNSKYLKQITKSSFDNQKSIFRFKPTLAHFEIRPKLTFPRKVKRQPMIIL